MPTTLGGRYRLDKLIGGGGMGEVWQAHDDVLDRVVAIKIIRPHLADDDNVRARLRVEAQLAGSLHHPGIVDVFDYGEDEEDGRPVPFLVMPLIDGAPLSAVLADRGRLSTGETMAVVSEIATALQVAHEAGIVHRDLKPGNILVTPDGRVMLVDFGIAHASGGEPLTQTGALIGTADYLSPEQASGRPATAASDLYSLGVVAHTCLTGTLPFHRDSDIATALAHLRDETPDLPDTVPAAAAALVEAMLAKEPDERPSSAADISEAAAVLATSVPPPPGHGPADDGEPTMPHAAAQPDGTLPGIVERAVTVGAGAQGPEHTAIVPATEEPTAGGRSVVAADHARRSRPRRMVLLGSVLAIAAIAALGWLVIGGDDAIAVPDVVGESQASATKQLEAEGLVVKVRKVNVAGHRRGEVVEQDPGSGDRVDEGATVTMSVATGRVRIPVDDLVGETYDEAVRRLDKLGLKAREVVVPSDQAPGTVIEVDPTKTAKIGSTVALTVAFGTPTSDGAEGDDESGDTSGNNGKGKNKDKGDNGKGNDTEVEPTPEPEPTTSPTTTAPPPGP